MREEADMKNKLRIASIIIIFLLIVPFRLPIGVLFIDLVTSIAEIAGNLSNEILVANVIVTKLIYDIALAGLSIYNLERVSISIKGRSAVSIDDTTIYWWTGASIVFFVSYIIYDAINTYELYYQLQTN